VLQIASLTLNQIGKLYNDMKNLIPILFASILMLTACGPEPEPTMSAEDVQGTAVSAAWTIVAETQAAIPTATPTIMPSPTPIPSITPTVVVLPTQPPDILPTATTVSDNDDCNRLLNFGLAGPTSPILIINKTKAPVNVSLGLPYRNVFGECGYRSYSLPKNGSIRIDFPRGDIYGFAWILEPINTTVQGGPWRPNNNDKWTIEIDEHLMKMIGP
jgi:hypothetical protein